MATTQKQIQSNIRKTNLNLIGNYFLQSVLYCYMLYIRTVRFLLFLNDSLHNTIISKKMG